MLRSTAILILMFSLTRIFSQEMRGIAIYQSKRQFDFEANKEEGGHAINEQMQEQIRKQFQKEYVLYFNHAESSYTEKEKLDAPAPGIRAGGKTLRIMQNGAGGRLYKNTTEKKYIHQQELMGKIFLVLDSLKLPEWTLENEKKTIGPYTCNKAKWTRKVTQKVYNRDEKDFKEAAQEKTTIVWYTPEIPIHNGPGEYWGLPGLILEVQEDNFSLMCTGIVLNPVEQFKIEIPEKGKEVSQETFNKIRDEKNREFLERQGGRNRENGNRTFSIRTEG
jgi:GLPGLI family protein